MTYFSTDAGIQLDGDRFPLDSISLSQQQIDQAVQLSQSADSPQQWQTYLNALAKAGFEQWLGDRASDLSMTQSPTESRVEVGAFKLCLLTMGSLSDTVIAVPEAAIDSAAAAAHLYVLLEVHEEQEQVLVKAVLRSDQLRQRQQLQGLTLDSDGTYSLPIHWFESNADDLLLYLRCLEPAALPLGGLQVAQDNQTSTELETDSQEVIAPTGELNRIATSLRQGAINTGLWLQNQLDAIAQELTWVLLPPTVASAMRYRGITGESPTEQFEQLISELGRSGVEVPVDARGAYRELQWGNVALRLYAVAWALPTTTDEPEWSLLVILGTPSTTIPIGVKVQIRDADQLLVERTIAPNAPQSYLYGRVIGTYKEQFWVTVDMANGAVVTFPPFSFTPNE